MKTHQVIVIILSFIAAYCLMVFPLPDGWRWFRPEWLTLAVIFWVFAFPKYIGVTVAWCAGLVMDILTGGILGQYALVLVLVAYVARILRARTHAFPFWQQSIGILLLVLLGELMILLVHWLMGNPPHTLLYWMPSLTSLALWPWMHRLLRKYERKKLR